MSNPELNKIKAIYGENFAKLCRTLFPTILEQKGLLTELITSNFAPTHNIYKILTENNEVDIFRDYIYSLIPIKNALQNKTTKSPEQLLDEAGYILYPECETEEDIQKFKKYYRRIEQICTFDGGRLNTCRVWFAVKKNVDSIKREDFKYPQRQDAYGTSVISIQFSKGDINYLSIKNRYNHVVDNPDSTFENNLENIIPGLTYAFCNKYNLNFRNEKMTCSGLNSAIRASNNLYYFFNVSTSLNYYCDENVILKENNFPVQLNKFYFLVIDNYIIDFANKKIVSEIPNDSFVNSIGKIKKMSVIKKDLGLKEIVITPKLGSDIIVTINSSNQIIGYKNNNVTSIGNYFLSESKELSFIDLPNVKTIGDCFLKYNKKLKEINLPNLKECGDYFLHNNIQIINANLPNLISIGNMFMENANSLTNIYIPKLENVKEFFLSNANNLKNLDAPNLTKTGNFFMYCGIHLETLNTPNLIIAGSNFLSSNRYLKELSLPNLTSAGDVFLYSNEILKSLDVPKLESVKNFFLHNNQMLDKLYLPELENVGDGFMSENLALNNLYAPKLKLVKNNFLESNTSLTKLCLPNLESVGNNFLYKNFIIKEIELPKLMCANKSFFSNAQNLKLLKMPKCTFINENLSFSHLTNISTLNITPQLNIFESLRKISSNCIEKTKS